MAQTVAGMNSALVWTGDQVSQLTGVGKILQVALQVYDNAQCILYHVY